MQDLILCGTDILKNSEETTQNYIGGAGQWTEVSWDHSN